ncbi:hypothetical protein HBA55_34685 [Pseudomaricurvus alkylphenolicus]|uniref:phage virion morphogenesis protein n=1 Tax=Pseudomaricurvus alkylphenolicus TaxID=1306991 RepID=UPI001420C322|nr:phage virion morphogenesis protein [Pseudomaricurvus alkylphenolicus]NIB44779.1 hypothetical protein [Pseudomaricurvus alkylphenolicus]
MSIRVDVDGADRAKVWTDMLKLPPIKRKRILGQVMRKVRTASRKRIREKKDLDGKPWAPRKKKRKGTKKGFRNFGRSLQTYYSEDKGRVDLSKRWLSGVAFLHQKGHRETVRASQIKRRRKTEEANTMATRRMGKALLALGYKIRRENGKGWKRPSLRWITENLTQRKAGILMTILGEEDKAQSWVTELPARSFLGASDDDVDALATTIMDNMLKRKGA